MTPGRRRLWAILCGSAGLAVLAVVAADLPGKGAGDPAACTSCDARHQALEARRAALAGTGPDAGP